MHPFAQFIQILGKGRNGMRPLDRQQAYEAMSMIVDGEVMPEQLGAFLMLMRVKEETAEEVAGFTQALRERMEIPQSDIRPAIDWAAYAGKKRHLPWFLLAALLLGQNGCPVFMHGLSREDERVYIPEALKMLGLPVADSVEDAISQLNAIGFSYLPIEKLSPKTAELIAMRDIFGLRPPLNTVARMLNPFAAPLSLMGVFHPNFSGIHQKALALLGQPRALVVKGEGGEFERVPDRNAELFTVFDGIESQVQWPAFLAPGKEVKPGHLDLSHLRAVWEGQAADSYGERAVIGTLAMVIFALGLEKEHEAAHVLAQNWWAEHSTTSLAGGSSDE